MALQHLRVQLELQQVLEQVVLLHLRAQVLQLRQEQVAPLHLRAQVLQLQQVLEQVVPLHLQVLRALIVSITFLPFKSTICIT